MIRADRPLATVLATVLLAGAARADEGMWTFHAPPKEQLKAKYGIELTDAWLDHVRLSSVRFGGGGSASFVSPHGLVLTNHHVGFSSIQKVSTEELDFVKHGCYARTLDSEIPIPDLELNVLVGMTDVTDRVKGAVPDGTEAAEATKLRRAEVAAIENEAKERTGLRCEVVSLYRGGEYWLYEYEKYDDVRLVMAPEGSIGYFGGDPDNFTYPRYNLDFALFRAWKDGRPASTPHFLKWNSHGVEEGDVVFTSGHPGRTERLMTYAQIERLRDVSRPRSLRTIAHLSAALRAYGAQGAEQERQAKDTLFSIENARKAYTGHVQGLADADLMARKEKEERELRAAVAENADLRAGVGDAWGDVERALADLGGFDDRAYHSRLRGDFGGLALHIVRLVSEREKPNGERLPAYRDAGLDALERRLFSDAPLFPGLEETMLRAGFELAAESLGEDDPFVVAALDGKSPAAAAAAVARKSLLYDPAARRALVDGGADAVASSTDPAIRLARAVDPILRELQEKREAVETAIALAAERIAEARFAVLGNTVYTDATFTLRL
ncbi:MAG: S46 family peptidase, partial [Planctomycetota bacterium JB042]